LESEEKPKEISKNLGPKSSLLERLKDSVRFADDDQPESRRISSKNIRSASDPDKSNQISGKNSTTKAELAIPKITKLEK
jgi:hypothetical protein